MYRNGFSLIELVLVIAIIGILVVFAYPGYRDSITKTRRIDGQTALLELANQMEQYYSIEQSYQHATIATGKETDIRTSYHSSQHWYFLQIAEQSDEEFSLEAIPLKAQAIPVKPSLSIVPVSKVLKQVLVETLTLQRFNAGEQLPNKPF